MTMKIHRCRPHYGDQTVERTDCVQAAAEAKAQAQRFAFTSAHPAYRQFRILYDHLTDAERNHLDSVVLGNGLIPESGATCG